MTGLGTMGWMARTGGRLAWHDKLTLVAQGVLARLASRRKPHGPEKLRHREVADIIPPDSAVAREAVALAQDCSPPYLFNHCLRAYFWARLLDTDGRAFDDEALFVALMLHDLGLTDRWRLQGQSQHCFTVVGAQAVSELALRHGWSDARATVAANAITLHLNVIVGAEHGKEAQMVRAGSGGDVAGLGLQRLAREQHRGDRPLPAAGAQVQDRGAAGDRSPRAALLSHRLPVPVAGLSRTGEGQSGVFGVTQPAPPR